MGKYLKLFDTTAQYNAYTADTTNFIKPNVSVAKDAPTIVYYSPWVETRLVAKYIANPYGPTTIGYNQYISGFSAIEVDGEELESVVSSYTFSTTGEHTVKYTLTDPTSISPNALFRCNNLVSLIVPDNVTTLGYYAFCQCRSLSSCTLSKNITNIDTWTFSNSSGLTSIVIPDSVTTIGNSSFLGCAGLTSLTIGSGVTLIDGNAFMSCSGLTSLTIPDNVTTIAWSAFTNCTSLTSVTIGSGVTSIDEYAFQQCSSLTSITLKSVVPPTLDTRVFNDTNDCPIYVPSGSVEAYKAASRWSNYASRIQAIP